MGVFLSPRQAKNANCEPTLGHNRPEVNQTRPAAGLPAPRSSHGAAPLARQGLAFGLDVPNQLLEGLDELLDALILQLPGHPLQVDAQGL